MIISSEVAGSFRPWATDKMAFYFNFLSLDSGTTIYLAGLS